MYHSTVASSSRPTTHDPWGLPTAHFSFPISDLRSTPPRPTVAPPTTLPPHTVTLPLSAGPCIDLTTSKYSTSVQLWNEIEPGVWYDGTNRVLSAAYPPVQDFLTTARHHLSLPVPPSDLIFVIAALDVFYNRNDPVHWMFWSDEKKYQTARVVNRIALRSPQLIRSKVAWNGISEYLFILSGLHGSSSLPTDKEWYQILNPSKAPPPPMNLRKRKIQPVEQTELLETPEEEYGSEVGESRPKRSKTRSTRHVRSRKYVTPEPAKLNSSDTTTSEASPASTTVSLLTEDQDMLSTVSPFSAASQEQTTLSTESPLIPQVKPSRQRSKVLQSSSTPGPSALPRAASPSPVSALITPTLSHTRNRSTSQASSQTLVSADARRSVSVLSNITAVEVGGGADEAIKADKAASDSEEADGKAEKKSASGMVTRGRANKARSTVDQGKSANRPTRPRAKRRAAK